MKHKIYIIILNYNGWKDTIECLESVLKNDYENYQIIVIDNASPNNSIEYIINWAEGKQEVIYDEKSQLKHLSQPHQPKPLDYVFYTKEEAINGGDKEKEAKLKNPIIFIQSGENRGFAAGNNIGIKYALAKDDFAYVWLLNNDTVVSSNVLELFISNKELDNNVLYGTTLVKYDTKKVQCLGGGYINGIIGYQKYYGEDFYTENVINNLNLQKEIENELDYIVGASMFVSKDILKKCGLLDEDYFLYWEETDYCFRLKSMGIKLKWNSNLVVYHKIGSSTDIKSKFTEYYSTRNTIKFLKKWYPKRLPIIFLCNLLLKIFNRIRRKQFDRIKLIIKSSFEGLK